jgi:hypothetical protein
LPFFNVELPLKAFFVLGPLVFLIVHAYVLLHFVLLAGKIGAFHAELQAQVTGDQARTRLRRQLPSNIFVQSLAGPREVRNGTIGFLLRLIVQISLVAGPIALLVLFQLQFLPYHNEWITTWQRTAVVIDLILLWILWPPIARGETARLGWNDFKRVKVVAWMLASSLPVLLVFTIATFPGEWLEKNLPTVPLVATKWPTWKPDSIRKAKPQEKSLLMEVVEFKRRTDAALKSMGWISLHRLLVGGGPDYVSQRPRSLWSNVLVLPNFEFGDRVKLDTEGKIAIASETISLRGRSLEGAVLEYAHLKRADFTGAQVAGADFTGADLRQAAFSCAHIGTEEKCAQLQGAFFLRAQLQGAALGGAQLQGADLTDAQLQDAWLHQAQLQGAWLDHGSCNAPRSTSPSCRAPFWVTRRCKAPRSTLHSCRAPRSTARSYKAPCSGRRSCRASRSRAPSCRPPRFMTCLSGEPSHQ